MILVTNIQRFSLHDGPGIRTTIFCKGCTLRCPWCSNPENLIGEVQGYIRDGVCGTYGIYYSTDRIYQEVMKDKLFYGENCLDYDIVSSIEIDRLPGGVTFSGGEAMLQMKKLRPLLEQLKAEHIHMAIETSLFIAPELLEIALQYIDLFYVDIKILDNVKCKKVLGGELDSYFSNLARLFSLQKPVIVRLPVIGGYTDDTKNKERIIELLSSYRPLRVEIIKEHTLGDEKYYSLGMQPLNLHCVTDEDMERYRDEIEKIGLQTEILKI